MEQRLGTIVCRAFDDCGNCESVFKVRPNGHILCMYIYEKMQIHVHVQPLPLKLCIAYTWEFSRDTCTCF